MGWHRQQVPTKPQFTLKKNDSLKEVKIYSLKTEKIYHDQNISLAMADLMRCREKNLCSPVISLRYYSTRSVPLEEFQLHFFGSSMK